MRLAYCAKMPSPRVRPTQLVDMERDLERVFWSSQHTSESNEITALESTTKVNLMIRIFLHLTHLSNEQDTREAHGRRDDLKKHVACIQAGSNMVVLGRPSERTTVISGDRCRARPSVQHHYGT